MFNEESDTKEINNKSYICRYIFEILKNNTFYTKTVFKMYRLSMFLFNKLMNRSGQMTNNS